MHYPFYIRFADEYGVDEAIMIAMFFSLDEYKKYLSTPLDYVDIDGESYVGFDEVDFETLLPFWSYDHCSSILKHLVRQDVLVTKAGRKDFYTFSGEFLSWLKEHGWAQPTESVRVKVGKYVVLALVLSFVVFYVAIAIGLIEIAI